IRGDMAVWCERILPFGWRSLELIPGGIGVFERDLARESGAPGVPRRLVAIGDGPIWESPGVIEEALAEDLPEVRPIKFKEGGDGLERLADHREVLQIPDLVGQEGENGRVERGDLGHEIVER